MRRLLLPLLLAAGCAMTAGAEELVFVVDESGSMKRGVPWLAALAQAIEAQTGDVRFGLVGFDRDARPLPVGGARSGSAEDLDAAVGLLSFDHSGFEDGYVGLQRVLGQYDDIRHVVLITDEDRDRADPAFEADDMVQALAEKDVTLTVFVYAEFRCSDRRLAIGMNDQSVGVVVDGEGRVAGCTMEHVRSLGNQTTVADYVDVALSSGGSAWSLYPTRTARTSPVQRAFVEQGAAALSQQIATLRERAWPMQATIGHTPRRPRVGEVVTFDASASRHNDPDAAIAGWAWDFDADGVADEFGPVVARIYARPAEHPVTLLLTDDRGETVERRMRITVR